MIRKSTKYVGFGSLNEFKCWPLINIGQHSTAPLTISTIQIVSQNGSLLGCRLEAIFTPQAWCLPYHFVSVYIRPGSPHLWTPLLTKLCASDVLTQSTWFRVTRLILSPSKLRLDHDRPLNKHFPRLPNPERINTHVYSPHIQIPNQETQAKKTKLPNNAVRIPDFTNSTLISFPWFPDI